MIHHNHDVLNHRTAVCEPGLQPLASKPEPLTLMVCSKCLKKDFASIPTLPSDFKAFSLDDVTRFFHQFASSDPLVLIRYVALLKCRQIVKFAELLSSNVSNLEEDKLDKLAHLIHNITPDGAPMFCPSNPFRLAPSNYHPGSFAALCQDLADESDPQKRSRLAFMRSLSMGALGYYHLLGDLDQDFPCNLGLGGDDNKFTHSSVLQHAAVPGCCHALDGTCHICKEASAIPFDGLQDLFLRPHMIASDLSGRRNCLDFVHPRERSVQQADGSEKLVGVPMILRGRDIGLWAVSHRMADLIERNLALLNFDWTSEGVEIENEVVHPAPDGCSWYFHPHNPVNIGKNPISIRLPILKTIASLCFANPNSPSQSDQSKTKPEKPIDRSDWFHDFYCTEFGYTANDNWQNILRLHTMYDSGPEFPSFQEFTNRIEVCTTVGEGVQESVFTRMVRNISATSFWNKLRFPEHWVEQVMDLDTSLPLNTRVTDLYTFLGTGQVKDNDWRVLFRTLNHHCNFRSVINALECGDASLPTERVTRIVTADRSQAQTQQTYEGFALWSVLMQFAALEFDDKVSFRVGYHDAVNLRPLTHGDTELGCIPTNEGLFHRAILFYNQDVMNAFQLDLESRWEIDHDGTGVVDYVPTPEPYSEIRNLLSPSAVNYFDNSHIDFSFFRGLNNGPPLNSFSDALKVDLTLHNQWLLDQLIRSTGLLFPLCVEQLTRFLRQELILPFSTTNAPEYVCLPPSFRFSFIRDQYTLFLNNLPSTVPGLRTDWKMRRELCDGSFSAYDVPFTGISDAARISLSYGNVPNRFDPTCSLRRMLNYYAMLEHVNHRCLSLFSPDEFTHYLPTDEDFWKNRERVLHNIRAKLPFPYSYPTSLTSTDLLPSFNDFATTLGEALHLHSMLLRVDEDGFVQARLAFSIFLVHGEGAILRAPWLTQHSLSKRFWPLVFYHNRVPMNYGYRPRSEPLMFSQALIADWNLPDWQVPDELDKSLIPEVAKFTFSCLSATMVDTFLRLVETALVSFDNFNAVNTLTLKRLLCGTTCAWTARSAIPHVVDQIRFGPVKRLSRQFTPYTGPLKRQKRSSAFDVRTPPPREIKRKLLWTADYEHKFWKTHYHEDKGPYDQVELEVELSRGRTYSSSSSEQ